MLSYISINSQRSMAAPRHIANEQMTPATAIVFRAEAFHDHWGQSRASMAHNETHSSQPVRRGADIPHVRSHAALCLLLVAYFTFH